MLSKIIEYFKPPKVWEIRQVIHFTPRDNMWGCRISWSSVKDGRVNGHFTPCVRDGDVFAAEMNSGKTGLFRLVNVKNCSDPRDMFFADTEAIGYAEDFPEYLHDYDLDILPSKEQSNEH